MGNGLQRLRLRHCLDGERERESAMSNLTAEQLIAAIRDADTLVELKRLVGPSEEDNERARLRSERMDQLWGRKDKLSYLEEEVLVELEAEQDRFEREWGL